MDEFILNGIDPITGDYLVPVLDEVAAAQAALTGQPADQSVAALHENAAKPKLGMAPSLNPEVLADAGWGIVFHAQEDAAVKSAFDTLIQHRAKQVNNPSKLKTLVYDGEGVPEWLAKHGVALGTVKPNKVPLYLLVVGDPERIPMEFTQILDLGYAVGRLYLDSAADYQRYADAVVAYETGAGITNSREAVFFGTQHINDGATNLSCTQLVKPLVEGVDGDPGVADGLEFKTQKLMAQDATKAGILEYLTRPAPQNPPAFLFSATHGLGWPTGDPRQELAQGALLCGDWKGKGFSPTPVPPTQYLAAADVKDGNVRNLIAFVFACYGLATPQRDRFAFQPPSQPKQLAPKPFFSALPKALLSNANGPALAVIGHLDRAWASSISPPKAGPQIEPFQNAIWKILKGKPLGLALTDFSERYGEFSGLLTPLLADMLNKLPVDNSKLATTWTQQNDAAAYMLFGDPAIRLRPEKLEAA